MTDLDIVAREVGVSGRTLRRAAARGTIRCEVASPRRILVPASERLYVRRHWSLLRDLIGTLRTQPNLRLAVVFGSIARGDEGPESDLDLLVRLREDGYLRRDELVERLRAATGRRVQVVSLEQAEEAPLLLADILRDGRVLVDRDGDWSSLKLDEHAIEARAEAEDERLEHEAWAVLQSLGAAHR